MSISGAARTVAFSRKAVARATGVTVAVGATDVRTTFRVAATATILTIALAGATASSALARSAGHEAGPRAAQFYVGAAKADVTPTSLTDFYLGGYGIGPVHEAQSVLRHIYFRVIAIGDRNGNQVVIGALDSQGYSVAYQMGPYGFRDIEDDIQAKLGIPADHIVLQATHTHNGPDEIGVWGGVPITYFQSVTNLMEEAITQAVMQEVPADIKIGTADMSGFSGTFGSDTDDTHTGDNADYPIDQQLRVLQAQTPRTHHVIATLVNYSSHPTVYGPLNAVSPDWPGATATYLEGDEQDTQPGARYGYPGSTAIVTIGAVGHTWPAGIPNGDTDPAVDPTSSSTDNNYPADMFGNAVARKAIGAVGDGHGFYLTQSVVDGTERMVKVLNTNAVLLTANSEPANSTPLGGYKIDRANTPPWGYGEVYTSPVTTLRVGDIPMFGVPGEPYPSVKFSLNDDVRAPVSFIFALAQDQLGYVEEPADYNGAFQCSTTDEWFFTISPVFGSAVVRLSQDNAKALGFDVTHSALKAYSPGTTAPSTNCTEEEIEGQGLSGLPVG
jgi:hypothetical protein